MTTNAAILFAAVLLTGPSPQSADSDSTGEATPRPTLVIEEAHVTLIGEASVPARESGVLIEVNVREGDQVKAGDALGRIDEQLAGLDVEYAEIDAEMAKYKSESDVDIRFNQTAARVAKAELDRAVASAKEYEKSVSKTELDRKQLVYDQSKLAIEQAERDQKVSQLGARLKQQQRRSATMKVARCELRSPIDGVVVEILHNKGEWLDPGEPLVRILTLNPLRVEFFVAASRYGQAELIGHQVELETQLPGDKKGLFAGEIVFVSPEIQPVNGQIRVYAEVQNPEYLLRPGARGKLTIQLDNE